MNSTGRVGSPGNFDNWPCFHNDRHAMAILPPQFCCQASSLHPPSYLRNTSPPAMCLARPGAVAPQCQPRLANRAGRPPWHFVENWSTWSFLGDYAESRARARPCSRQYIPARGIWSAVRCGMSTWNFKLVPGFETFETFLGRPSSTDLCPPNFCNHPSLFARWRCFAPLFGPAIVALKRSFLDFQMICSQCCIAPEMPIPNFPYVPIDFMLFFAKAPIKNLQTAMKSTRHPCSQASRHYATSHRLKTDLAPRVINEIVTWKRMNLT